MSRMKLFSLVGLVLIASMVITACQPQTVEKQVPVEVTKVALDDAIPTPWFPQWTSG